jgi:hypothetical protein
VKKTLLALMLCAAAGAQAAPRGFIDTYKKNNAEWNEICVNSYLVSWDAPKMLKAGDDCIGNAKTILKSNYQNALGQVDKKPSKALEDHYVKALTLLESARPLEIETRSTYAARIGRSHSELSEAWVRFELAFEAANTKGKK